MSSDPSSSSSPAGAKSATPENPQRLYGRRKGPTMSQRQEQLLETLLPTIRVPAAKEMDDIINPADLFPKEITDYWFEVGFGKGEHLYWQAEHFPTTGMIGCEFYLNGVASLLGKIDENARDNIRLYEGDARHVMKALPEASISRAFLLHPDPWPKNRHAKRRFVSQENLDLFARLLKDNCELRIGTDHPVYARWTMLQMSLRDDFIWMAEGPDDWRKSPDDWPETRYEQKAKDGIPVYLRFKRLPRS